ncbi:hypothetical protein ACJRO7_007194 [Eucalyptus globulus]|uniref:Uncharacterized protein n=1 Tax=Eucalyptus globulus TaxID=34317 RepID=A0ABD3IKE2_EUCGL
MLHKLLKLHKPAPAAAEEEAAAASSSALKIVHAGGLVECYFMPVPAARIVERYPAFYVTRPEVFRRPWEAVVGPHETLALGEKYYLVPRRTVKKLRRGTRRPGRDDRSADLSASRSFHGGGAAGATRRGSDGDSSGSFVERGGGSGASAADYVKVSKRKSSTAKKHVRFRGIDEKPRKGPPEAAAGAAAERKHRKVVENARKGLQKKSQSGGEKRKDKVTPTWQPALASISEISGSDE